MLQGGQEGLLVYECKPNRANTGAGRRECTGASRGGICPSWVWGWTEQSGKEGLAGPRAGWTQGWLTG